MVWSDIDTRSKSVCSLRRAERTRCCINKVTILNGFKLKVHVTIPSLGTRGRTSFSFCVAQEQNGSRSRARTIYSRRPCAPSTYDRTLFAQNDTTVQCTAATRCAGSESHSIPQCVIIRKFGEFFLINLGLIWHSYSFSINYLLFYWWWCK